MGLSDASIMLLQFSHQSSTRFDRTYSISHNIPSERNRYLLLSDKYNNIPMVLHIKLHNVAPLLWGWVMHPTCSWNISTSAPPDLIGPFNQQQDPFRKGNRTSHHQSNVTPSHWCDIPCWTMYLLSYGSGWCIYCTLLLFWGPFPCGGCLFQDLFPVVLCSKSYAQIKYICYHHTYYY